MPYCARCGAEMKEGTVYCPKCGAPVGASAPTVAPASGPVRQGPVMSPLTIALVAVAAVLIIGAAASASFLGFLVPFNSISGSGNPTSRDYSYSGFTGVELSSGFRFTITESSTFSIVVTTDDNIVDDVQVTMTGSLLSVGLAPGHGYSTTTLKVAITMPDLSRLEMSGGVSGTVTGLNSQGGLAVDSSAGSSVVVSGTTGSLQIGGSGGTNLNLRDLHVTSASVDLSGGSQATVSVNGTLSYSLSGGSRLFYYGNPVRGDQSATGGSSAIDLG